jgi:Pentapeptide repeats (9 copies)
MNRDESIALYERAQAAEEKKKGDGAKVWNVWAEEMLDRKAELEGSGQWQTKAGAFGPLVPQNQPTREWLEAAAADFSNHIFQDADFGRCSFPAAAHFDQAIFSGDANFCIATFEWAARFDGATFKGDAGFLNARFKEHAGFASATFNGSAGFGGATFKADAGFGGATFKADAGFGGATFKADAGFAGARFERCAGFLGARFKAHAGFDGARFKWYAGFDGSTFKADAGFGGARFKGHAGFASARFERDARFERATCQRSFILGGAEFWKIPDFIQTTFSEAPRFDNVRIRVGPLEPKEGWRRILPIGKRAFKPGPNDAARYRALKGLALKGHDHDSELSFFAGEIISRRGVEDFALPRPSNILRAWKMFQRGIYRPQRELVWRWQKGEHIERAEIWPGGARYWAGQAYETLSDFGRSMLRPLGWWIVLMGMYAVAYLSQYFVASCNSTALGGLVEAYRWAGTWLLNKLSFGAFAAPADLACHSASKLVVASKMEPWGAAGYVAARRALILNTGDDNDKLSFAYACLYGDYSDVTQAKFRVIPHIPDAVSALAIMQSLLSAALIFLFLLAVRNQFRIK